MRPGGRGRRCGGCARRVSSALAGLIKGFAASCRLHAALQEQTLRLDVSSRESMWNVSKSSLPVSMLYTSPSHASPNACTRKQRPTAIDQYER